MNQQRILSVFAWACLSLLGACGGGGGAGDPGLLVPLAASGSAPNPPSNPAPAETSLVPEAGPVGAILYADAAPLRVLRPGAAWTYHGTIQPQGMLGADNVTYANKISFTGPDAQGYTQHSTNFLNLGAGSGRLRYEGGAYLVGAVVEFIGSPSRIDEAVADLRSPVRTNDLYGIVERKNLDFGSDLDNDRVNETAAVALYSRVVGKESVDLPNRRGVEAVRVDMTMRMRVTTSAQRTALPLYESVRSYWYAPGLGLVKYRLDEPNATAGLPNRVVTEVLENWDGLTEGLGHLPAQTSSAMQSPFAAVAFEAHAVVAGQPPGTASPTGIALVQLDTRGGVVAERRYTAGELFPGAEWIVGPNLLRSGAELRLFVQLSNGRVGMASFDATGQRILRPPVTVVSDAPKPGEYDSIDYYVVADGAGFWLAWQRLSHTANGPGANTALLVRLDTNGQPQGAPRVVMQPVPRAIQDFSMAAVGNQVGLSWYEGNPTGARHLVTADTASMGVTSSTLDMASGDCFQARVLNLQPGLALTCWSNWGTPVGAARIDASGQVVRANPATAGAALAGEAIKAPWLTNIGEPPLGTGAGGELYIAARQSAPRWPGDSAESFTTVLRTNSGGGPLAAREPVLLARLLDWRAKTFAMAQFEHHLLLLGSDSDGKLNTAVVWLPK